MTRILLPITRWAGVSALLLALITIVPAGARAEPPIAVRAGDSAVLDRAETPFTAITVDKGAASSIAGNAGKPPYALVYVPPPGQSAVADKVEYTVDGKPKTVLVSVQVAAPDFTGALYEKSFKALFILFILAVLVENGLALLFRWRPFLSVFDTSSVNPVVSFGLSLVFVSVFHLDIVTGLLNIYSDEHWPQNWPGSILTAMIIAGGSGAVNRVFRAFGLRVPASEELATPKPPSGVGWIAVTLAPASRAVGTVTVLISPANIGTVAGTIDGGAHGLNKLTALFLRNARRFPRNGGHSVKSGESYTVIATGHDAAGATLSASWGPYTVDSGAVIDIELNPA